MVRHQDEVLLDQREAAHYLKLKNQNTLSNWRHQCKGPPYVKMCRSIRYRAEDLRYWAEAQRVNPERSNSELAQIEEEVSRLDVELRQYSRFDSVPDHLARQYAAACHRRSELEGAAGGGR